jgi:hypothetical protein
MGILKDTLRQFLRVRIQKHSTRDPSLESVLSVVHHGDLQLNWEPTLQLRNRILTQETSLRQFFIFNNFIVRSNISFYPLFQLTSLGNISKHNNHLTIVRPRFSLPLLCQFLKLQSIIKNRYPHSMLASFP